MYKNWKNLNRYNTGVGLPGENVEFFPSDAVLLCKKLCREC